MHVKHSHGLTSDHGSPVTGAGSQAATADVHPLATGAPIVGNDSDNRLFGTDNDESINGRGGDDTLDGGLGDDTIDGGSGRDLADYRNSGGSVTVDLATGTATGVQGADKLINIEDVRTDFGYSNSITGDSQSNALVGGDMDDTLRGGAGGDDSLLAAAGDDVIYGTAGHLTAYGAQGDDTVYLSTDPGFINGGSEAADPAATTPSTSTTAAIRQTSRSTSGT